MKKIITTSLIGALFFSMSMVFALMPKEAAKYFNGPTVTAVTDTSAHITLSQAVLADITADEMSGVYFQYYQTHQVCIMIYPTPAECLPKKTNVGKTDVTLTNLKPNTSYTVVYRRDNTIRCITTPCPSNEFESLSVEFTTKASGTTTPPTGTTTPSTPQTGLTKNLGLGSRGVQVVILQNILIQQGYLRGSATGYFGLLTRLAVIQFQKAYGISPTGVVGPITRNALFNVSPSTPIASGEKFEGTITAYSTGCFADGICSITIDGKKVVTTIGRSQQVVGSVTGIPDFGSVASKVGSHAKVYAKKTDDGYTLYGSADYYIQIQ